MSLRELYFKANFILTNTDSNLLMDNSLKMSHMSMIAYKSKFLFNKAKFGVRFKLPIIQDVKLKKNIRNALVGGRCQIFNLINERT